MKYLSKIYIVLVCSMVVVACGATKGFYRHETAMRLATPAYMIERQIPAGQFALTAFERVHERGAPANIYIEGDGQAWLSKSQKSGDPTPVYPLALHLASKDNADNVIYLARPCQYSGANNGSCDNDYWGQKRYAPEVVASYVKALDNIKTKYGVSGFNLIGYSGGGAVAALLAAEREDVLSLRTVAGNVDHAAHSALHGVSKLDGSLNPVDHVAHLRDMPQIHFIGKHDKIVPESIAQSYMNALGDNNCAMLIVVDDTNHEDGWVNRWPELLKTKPICKNASVSAMPMTMDDDWAPLPAPIRTERERPSKP